jgi:hypothetical protein
MHPLIHRLLQQPMQLIVQVDTLTHHVDKSGGAGDGGDRRAVVLLSWCRQRRLMHVEGGSTAVLSGHVTARVLSGESIVMQSHLLLSQMLHGVVRCCKYGSRVLSTQG